MIIHQTIYNFAAFWMGYHQQFFYSFDAPSVPVKHGFLKKGFQA